MENSPITIPKSVLEQIYRSLYLRRRKKRRVVRLGPFCLWEQKRPNPINENMRRDYG